jgi:nucleotide-binding universal stress UspA family protein
MLRHLLFPIDFSAQSKLAMPYVRAFAQRFGAKVSLISVVPAIWTTAPAGPGTRAPANAAALEIEFRSRLEKAMAGQWEGITVECIVRSGDPAGQIISYAHEHQVDLIMMPTHGAGAFRSLLIGSVAAKVLHDARCPVWTATHAREQSAPAVPKKILCAVDGSPRSGDLIRWAAQFSGSCDAELELLHVVPPVSDWPLLPGDKALAKRLQDEARSKILTMRDAVGVNAPLRIAVGDIPKTVAEEAGDAGADLLIIARGAAATERLRAHAYGIVHRSPCPVLSV